jgi:hypothetical protein
MGGEQKVEVVKGEQKPEILLNFFVLLGFLLRTTQ